MQPTLELVIDHEEKIYVSEQTSISKSSEKVLYLFIFIKSNKLYIVNLKSHIVLNKIFFRTRLHYSTLLSLVANIYE
jgi:hypothetical protein